MSSITCVQWKFTGRPWNVLGWRGHFEGHLIPQGRLSPTSSHRLFQWEVYYLLSCILMMSLKKFCLLVKHTYRWYELTRCQIFPLHFSGWVDTEMDWKFQIQHPSQISEVGLLKSSHAYFEQTLSLISSWPQNWPNY